MRRLNQNRRSSSPDLHARREIEPYSYLPSVFLSYIPVLVILILYLILNTILVDSSTLYVFILSIIFIGSNLVSYSILSAQVQFFSVYWRACLLANTFLLGAILTTTTTSVAWRPFGYYMMALSFFHTSEFVFTATFNHRDVSTDSFLLNHSREYGVAALASWLEFALEAWLAPSLKCHALTLYAGLGLVYLGETFRKLAMYTAGRSFNHYVQEERHNDHVLITSGVYALVRHPSYFGWFVWSVGTQVLLANPVCTVLYAFVSWKFFKSRIVYEEFYLIKFFGKQYVDYQRRVPSGIPFVKGFLLVDEALD